MNALISVLKKDGGKFEKAVEFNPALMSLGETVQDVLANATFHEWGSVLVEFDYKEKGEYTKEQEDEAEREYLESETRRTIDVHFRATGPVAGVKFCPVHGLYTDDIKPCTEGIPADYVAHTKPPEFK